MKVLVTGGAGFIGSVLVPMLLGDGHSVRVLDNLMHGGNSLLPLFRDRRFEFQRGDIRDLPTVRTAVQGCDAVIHLAAIVGFPACRRFPDLAQTVNVEGTRNVAAAAGPDRLVLFGSTGSNYGALVDDLCTEETPLNPLSLYGKTKTAAERHLMNNCRTVAYRFATAFGVSPRLRLDLLINEFVYQAVKLKYLVIYERHFMRTFIHVHDIARSFLFALDHADRMAGQVYNVGSATLNFSKQQLCEMIRSKVDYYLHFAEVGEDQDKRNYCVSYDKINQVGYQTTISLEDGIDELIRADGRGRNPQPLLERVNRRLSCEPSAERPIDMAPAPRGDMTAGPLSESATVARQIATDRPRISYVLATWNRAAFLRQALEQVRDWIDPQDELIVIDGGSTDDTRSVVASFGNLISRFVSEPDRGEAHAFNKGVLEFAGSLCKVLV